MAVYQGTSAYSLEDRCFKESFVTRMQQEWMRRYASAKNDAEFYLAEGVLDGLDDIETMENMDQLQASWETWMGKMYHQGVGFITVGVLDHASPLTMCDGTALDLAVQEQYGRAVAINTFYAHMNGNRVYQDMQATSHQPSSR